jgi:hypothetical protein
MDVSQKIEAGVRIFQFAISSFSLSALSQPIYLEGTDETHMFWSDGWPQPRKWNAVLDMRDLFLRPVDH